MRVLINASSARLGGGLSYITAQLAAIERNLPDGWACDVIVAPWNAAEVSAACGFRQVPLSVTNARTRFLGEQRLMATTRTHDLLYCPGNFGPLVTRVPYVLTVQNPNYFGRGRSYPQNRSASRRAKVRLSELSVRRAQLVIAISNSLATDIIDSVPSSVSRLVVIRSGAPHWPDAAPPRYLEAKSAEDYFLVLGNDYPHKRLADVVASWKLAGGAAMAELMIAGEISESREHALRRPLEPADQGSLTFLGPIHDRGEVRWLLENCLALVQASELEAYPLTPGEAASLGTACILSDIEPHREVTASSAVYFPVGDVAALGELMSSAAHHQVAASDWTDWSWDDHAIALCSAFSSVVR